MYDDPDNKNQRMELKLFMLLLGCKPKGRHVEQHDYFFGIAESVDELYSEVKNFWPEAAGKIHIDAWREVTKVDGHKLMIEKRASENIKPASEKLFFINLGGYQENKFEEQHYTLLTLQPDMQTALKEAKKTLFFRQNQFEGATSHIDDKYGIDVDDIYLISDILSEDQKNVYSISFTASPETAEDEIHLGYLKIK
jgi:hypothetical protein